MLPHWRCRRNSSALCPVLSRSACWVSQRRLRGFPLLLALLWVTLCMGGPTLWHAVGPTLLLNYTASLPLGVYVVVPPQHLTRGMLIVFPPPVAVASLIIERGWLPPQTPLLKPLAALPGDEVCVQDTGLFINQAYAGPVATVDRLERPLPQWRGCVVLHPEEVFPASLHSPFSFDGRYFGPVAVSTIQGVAQPLWTFSW